MGAQEAVTEKPRRGSTPTRRYPDRLVGEGLLSELLRELDRDAEGMSTATLPTAARSYSPRYFETAQWSLRPIRLALLAAGRPTVASVSTREAVEGDNRPPNNLNGQDIVSCIRMRD